MKFAKVFYIPRRAGAISIALVLLTVLCLVAVWSNGSYEMVMSYGVANKVITIDPGHGGFDPGAQRGDICEKDITLAISKELTKQLSQAGSAVILLRNSDQDLADKNFTGALRDRKRQDLGRRVDKANQSKADLYVSIHTNADPSPRWRGAQCFYCASSEESRLVAECIQEELTRILGNTKRKALSGNFFITERTQMPAVIVEVGFISNPEEGRLLMDPEYQKKVAQAIFSGIVKSQSRLVDNSKGNP